MTMAKDDLALHYDTQLKDYKTQLRSAFEQLQTMRKKKTTDF